MATSNKSELITLAAAHQIGQALQLFPTIETDSQSVISKVGKTLRQPNRSTSGYSYGAAYTTIAAIRRTHPLRKLKHVTSHADKRGGPNSWTPAETRNIIADAYADPNSSSTCTKSLRHKQGFTEVPLIPETILTVDVKTVLHGLHGPHTFYWENPTGYPCMEKPFAPSAADIFAYLEVRGKSTTTGFDWTDSCMGLLQRIWKKLKFSGRGKKMIFLPHLWDKQYHGRNLAKLGIQDESRCILCHTGADDQPHNLLQCMAPALVVLRQHFFKTIQKQLSGSIENKPQRFLRTLYSWVASPQSLEPPYHRSSVLLGRPTAAALQHGSVEGKLTPAEGSYMQAIQSKLWLLSIDYARQAWKLRNHLLHMPAELWHRTTEPAPGIDEIRQLISNPVYQPGSHRRPRGLLGKGFRPISTPTMVGVTRKRAARTAPPPPTPKRRKLTPSPSVLHTPLPETPGTITSCFRPENLVLFSTGKTPRPTKRRAAHRQDERVRSARQVRVASRNPKKQKGRKPTIKPSSTTTSLEAYWTRSDTINPPAAVTPQAIFSGSVPPTPTKITAAHASQGLPSGGPALPDEHSQTKITILETPDTQTPGLPPETFQTQNAEAKGDATRPIILLVGCVELTEAAMRVLDLVGDRKWNAHAYRDTIRIRSLRTLVGPSWSVLSIAVNLHLLDHDQRHSFDLRYGPEMKLHSIREAGHLGEIHHVMFDYGHRMPGEYLRSRFPEPLGILHSPQELSATVTIWLPGHHSVSELLTEFPPNKTLKYLECSVLPPDCHPWVRATQAANIPTEEGTYRTPTNFFCIQTKPTPTLRLHTWALQVTNQAPVATYILPAEWRIEEPPSGLAAGPALLLPPPLTSAPKLTAYQGTRAPAGKPKTEPRFRVIVTRSEKVPTRQQPLRRSGRPVSYHEERPPQLPSGEPLPGKIPTSELEKVVQQATSIALIKQEGDHPDMWVGPSYHHASSGMGLYVRFDEQTRYPPHYRIGRYTGTTNLDLNITAQEALALWGQDDYILFNPGKGIVLQGARTNGPSYANDGFRQFNAYIHVHQDTGQFELALRGQPEQGVYEVLTNYDEAGHPPNYWTSERLNRLPAHERKRCLDYYPPKPQIKKARTARPTSCEQESLPAAGPSDNHCDGAYYHGNPPAGIG